MRNTLVKFVIFVLFLSQAASAQGTTSSTAGAKIPEKRQNNIQYACEAFSGVTGNKADTNWCSCQNEYYRNLLTPSDWDRYSEDYTLLLDAQSSDADTPANSYARKVQLGGSYCAGCKSKNYAGCMKKADPVQAMIDQTRLIFAGDFSKVRKDAHYSRTFVDYVSAYSAHCSHRISSGTRFVTEVYKNGYFDERYEVLVEDAFVQSFRKHRRISSDAVTAQSMAIIGQTLSQSNPFDVTGIVDFGANLSARAKIMEENVKSTCDNAAGYTLRENFLRFELGKPPLINENSKGMADALATKTSAATHAATAERARIIAATKASYERAKVRWAERAAEAQRVKPLICTRSGIDPNYGPVSDETRRTVSSFTQYAGSWRGAIHGRPAELLTWDAGFGRGLAGLVYFPDLSCALAVEAKPNKPQPMTSDYVSYSLHQYSMKTGFCSMKLGGSYNFDIGAGFYLSPDSRKQALRLVPGNASKAYNAASELGFEASCETAEFKPTPLSQPFKRLIETEQAGWGQNIPYWVPGKRLWQGILQEN